MRTEINLLLQKQGVKPEVRNFLVYAIGIFAVSFILAAGAFLYSFVLTIQLDNKAKQEEQLTAQIKTMEQKKQRMLVLDERLNSISTILKTRRNLSEKLGLVTTHMPEGLSFQSVSVTADKISMNIESADLASTNTFLERIYNLQKDVTLIKKAELAGFGNSEGGKYNMQLSFDLVK